MEPVVIDQLIDTSCKSTTVALMAKAVQFDSYGGIDVLEVRDVPRPVPGAGEVLVEVRAAGINTSEAAIRAGAVRDMFPATFPSGQGSDLAGVVAELGSGVSGFAVGDEVIGFSNATVQPRRVRDGAREPVDTQAVAGAVGGGRLAVCCGRHCLRRGAGGAPRTGGDRRDRGCGRRCRFDRGSTRPTRRGHGPRHRRAVQRCLAHRPWRCPGQLWRRPAGPAARRSTVRTHRRRCWISSVVDMSRWRSRTSQSRATGSTPSPISMPWSGSGFSRQAVRMPRPQRWSPSWPTSSRRGELEVPIAGVFALDDVRDAYRELEKRHTRGKLVLRP